MPACYSTPQDFCAEPVGLALKQYWPITPGVLDRLLFRASTAADQYVGRHLIMPPATTVTGSVTLPAGTTTVPLANVMGIWPTDAMIVDGETVEIADATFTRPAAPIAMGSLGYPGTVTLRTPTTTPHSVGASVAVYRQDRWRISGRATRPNDMGVQLSQEGQIAVMHAPALGLQTSSRRIFLAQYPIISVAAMYQALPYGGNSENGVDFSSVYIDIQERFLRLPIGYYNPPDSIWRIQYRAGYVTPPEDIVSAVHLLVADEISQQLNPMGAHMIRVGTEMQMLSPNTRGAVRDDHPVSARIERAYELLEPYRRRWGI